MQNRPIGELPVRFTRAARKHRIGRAHVLYVMNTHQPIIVRSRYYWLASDDRGLQLEVIAIADADAMVVIHVMPYQLRRKD